jgi:hypothetical protein
LHKTRFEIESGYGKKLDIYSSFKSRLNVFATIGYQIVHTSPMQNPGGLFAIDKKLTSGCVPIADWRLFPHRQDSARFS